MLQILSYRAQFAEMEIFSGPNGSSLCVVFFVLLYLDSAVYDEYESRKALQMFMMLNMVTLKPIASGYREVVLLALADSLQRRSPTAYILPRSTHWFLEVVMDERRFSDSRFKYFFRITRDP
jgi:hypothetical protein